MPDKYLVEFLAEWINDPALRAKVLHKEKTELETWGADLWQSDDLRSLDKKRILERLVKELENDLEIDLQKILDDMDKTDGGGFGGAAGAVYQEGHAHVRGVEPEKVPAGIETVVIVRGHGWDSSLGISFKPLGGGTTVVGDVLQIDSDIDVWQRAMVKVNLPTAGEWRILAEVSGSDDSTEKVNLEVVALGS